MLEIALLILTINPNGDIRSTVSAADDLTACQQSLETVVGILQGAGTEVVKAACARTAERLTPFDHGKGVADEVYRYRVILHPDRFSLTPFEAGECSPGVVGNTETFCTVSSQQLLQ